MATKKTSYTTADVERYKIRMSRKHQHELQEAQILWHGKGKVAGRRELIHQIRELLNLPEEQEE